MTTRITGLSNSGLDTDALVKSLMTAQRARYDKIAQQKTQAEWKKNEYNTLYKSLTSFRNNTVFNFKLSNVLAGKKAASSDETKVSATAAANATDFTHTLAVTKVATGASMSSSAQITAGLIDTTITINGQAVAVHATDTLNDLASTINNTAGINVKATYDVTLQRLFMYSTDSGSTAKIALAGTDAASTDLLNNTLHLSTAAPTVAAGTLGEDAAFTIDGVSSASLGITTNKFTVSGVNYEIKATGTVSVIVASDTDKVVASVKSFIESYNTMLDSINTKTNETVYRSYLPLTTDQRSAMSETDIKAWEEKAKSGILKNDSTLNSLSYAMRDSFSSAVSGITGSYTTASSIGITTGEYYEKGKLYLDENKLKAALAADPQIVQKLFGTDGATASNDGIAVRLYDKLKEATDKIKVDAGTTAVVEATSNLGKKISEYEKTLAALNTRLTDMETSYYKKFSAMETALTKLNSQSSWLTQQLASA